MARIQERFEIASPAMAVYDALSQPETLLGTLPGISSIYRFDPTHYRVQVGSAGRAHQMDIEITERQPGRRLAWRSGDGRWTGTVDMEPREAGRTLVLLDVHDAHATGEPPPDNGETASVVDAALQHLKSALQMEATRAEEAQAAHAAGEDTIHVSRGSDESERAGSERWAGAHGEQDWRGSQGPSSRGENSHAFVRMLSREMDRWWEQLQRGAAAARRTVGNLPSGLNPPIEICERDEEVIVFADVPGLDSGDVQVRIDEGLLTIRGERKPDAADAKSVRRSERPYGAFVRRVVLPEGLQLDAARAVLRNGVLHVRVPVVRSQRSRTVRVETDVTEPKG
jgi:HSP20 family protein